MLDNLTIIIITYQRYSFLKRLLSFHLSYNSKVKYIVLDSSEDYPEDKHLLEMLSSKQVTWKRFPSDIFFLKKIAQGCELANTDYLVLSPDDDFLIPTALQECLNFLKLNKDYSSAHGLSFSHHSYKKGQDLDLSITPFHNGKCLSLEQDSALERINLYMTDTNFPYYPMYAIHHKEDFCFMWQESEKYVDSQGLSELLPCCLSLMKGKMKVLPNFYNLRQPNNFNGWDDKETLSKVYSQKRVHQASLGLAKNINQDNYLSLKESRVFSNEVFDKYLKHLYKKLEKAVKSNSSLTGFFSDLRQRLGIRTKIRNIINKIFYKGSHHLVYPKYISDFEKVKKNIIDFDLTFEELNQARRKIEYPE